MSKNQHPHGRPVTHKTVRNSLRRVARFSTAALPIYLLLVAGCATTERGNANAEKIGNTPPNASRLSQRAQAYWKARGTESWDDLYQFQPPRLQVTTTVEQYRQWATAEEPFLLKEWSIKDQFCEGTFGWVRVDYTASLRRFPNLPPKAKTHWQRWVALEGEWYPVPQTELDDFPDTPAARDTDAERVLRARFEGTWAARKNRDWSALYEWSDPRDLDTISLEQFADSESRFIYLAMEIHWVEVKGDFGRIRVTYAHKPADPNMTKMAVQRVSSIEHWVRVDGQWYRDLVQNKG